MPICSVLNNIIIYCKASLVKQVQRKQVKHVVFTYFHIDHNAPYLPPPPPHHPHFPEFCITIVSNSPGYYSHPKRNPGEQGALWSL